MRFLHLLTLVGVVAASWRTSEIERVVDLSSQIVKIDTLYIFENTGAVSEKTVKIILTAEESEKLAYISAGIDGIKGKLKIGSPEKAEKPGFFSYSIDLRSPVPKGQQVKIRVAQRLTASLEPLPARITQAESQFVVYQGSAYTPSPYEVLTQKTVIKTQSGGKIISSTAVTPHKQEQDRILYGPYPNIKAFELKPVKIHYENNFPFVVATLVERVIEVSHWGNIAVEEYIELENKGAQLEGSFSRLDHQMDRRGRRLPALQQFTTILPATARDIYYRDEIGNISTSAVRIRAKSVELDIRPRYPLFGGWKTSYVIGYNVPAHDYLYTNENQYALKFKLFDHVFENVAVEKLVTKIILPERVRKIKIATPYKVERRPDEIKPTYLDTTGRLVVVLHKNNVVDEHGQVFTLTYEFDYIDMFREPLMVTAFFFSLFLVAIVYSRFDFTLVSSKQQEAEARLQMKIEALHQFVESKNEAYESLVAAALDYKGTRDEEVLNTARKRLAEIRNEMNEKLNETIKVLKTDASKSAEKAAELIKYDKAVFELTDKYLTAVEKNTSKSGCEEERMYAKKLKECRSRADALLAGL
ncbi:unnamed protein product [Caenorhabditis bovis]|uniref:Dolichyl-diphosphooligosaccharide--protein glycosyltransferase subunit 1 n=1 Tax=Caenorhabditis bovis TaxID=2654633 RepID=A0A8S1F621_9PELO|nr:unnamed protein product [Caenorhabditis bovis]